MAGEATQLKVRVKGKKKQTNSAFMQITTHFI